MTIKTITPTELHERMQAGQAVNLIDVRSPAEYAEVHAVGARLVPLDTLSRELVPVQDGQPVYVICRSGGRSLSACARLVEQGLANVVNVDGGTMAWQKAGLPVETSGGPGGGSSGGGRTNWLRIGGLLGVVISLVLGMTVNVAFSYAAVGFWILLVLTGNGPCCWSGTCSTGKGEPGV